MKKIPELIEHLNFGKTLLIGEGNFSFSVCLSGFISPNFITATCFEKSYELTDKAGENIRYLKALGTRVFNSIDATELTRYFAEEKFANILFQFPHAGTRQGRNGEKSSYALVRKFLLSAKKLLCVDGRVFVTVVDSDFYNSVFRFAKLQELCGFRELYIRNFNPSDFVGYVHSMTNSNESAIENYKQFATYIFVR